MNVCTVDTDGKKGSIPGERKKTADIGQLDIVHYGEKEDDKSSSEKAQSEVGSKVGSSVHGKSMSKSGAGEPQLFRTNTNNEITEVLRQLVGQLVCDSNSSHSFQVI